MALQIKNWGKFQHYKNRNPPWIKLYRDLLEDPEWWDLDGDASKTLANCWLIASRHGNDGTLPDVKKLAFLLRTTEKQLNQQLLKLKHFVLADCQQSACLREQSSETEREGENINMSGYRTDGIKLITFLNEKAGRHYEANGANLEMVIARLKEGRTERDLRIMVAKKINQWRTDEAMAKYLRPATLFNRTKCAQYLGED